jgi:hypothetical protein
MFYAAVTSTEKLRRNLPAITICIAKLYVWRRTRANEQSFVSVQHRALYMKICVLCIVAGSTDLPWKHCYAILNWQWHVAQQHSRNALLRFHCSRGYADVSSLTLPALPPPPTPSIRICVKGISWCVSQTFCSQVPFGFEQYPRSSHTCPRKCPDGRYPELKKCISGLISDSYEHIPAARNNALRYLTLITVTVRRFVGTGSFVISYSSGNTKSTSPIKEVLRLFLTRHSFSYKNK